MKTNAGYSQNYPHKFESIFEAPGQFSEALGSLLSASDAFRLILYAPVHICRGGEGPCDGPPRN